MTKAITLLGGFQVYDNGCRVTGFQSDKARALLAYLAVEAERPHRRTQLAGLFWSEWPEQTALTYVRHALANLRKVLGENDVKELPLLATHTTIQFNRKAAYQVDVTLVMQALETLTTPTPVIACLQEAVEAYQHPMLDGFCLNGCAAFEEWLLLTREGLQRQIVEALRHLADHFEAQGNYRQACRYAQRRVELEPWLEEAHRQIMRLHALNGQRSAALAHYDRCRRQLAVELGVEPSAETTALYEAIRTSQLEKVEPKAVLAYNNKVTALVKPISSPSHPLTASSKHNLPAPTTPLLGRTRELATLQGLLRRKEVRLVTLTGPGGVGKTRIGLQAATDLLAAFADGCFFVPLAPIQDAGFVISAIAQVLGVREAVARSLLESVQIELKSKALLLVLDNFEHVMPAAPVITALLAACPHVKILVTSREVLRLYGEYEFVVPSLVTPPLNQSASLATLASYEAVTLFIERARAVKLDFAVDATNAPAVAEICARLDGLPLAIELVAARVKFFLPPLLLKQLIGATGPAALQVLHGGARDLPERHQTMRRAIAWSYDLLDAEEQALFCRLAVFAGGFTPEAVAALYADMPTVEKLLTHALGVVWPAPSLVNPATVQPIRLILNMDNPVSADTLLVKLQSLVNKSLVRQEEFSPNGELRFTLLETIRAYGLALLQEQRELAAIQHRHACYYLALAVDAETQVNGADDGRWLAWLASDYNNLRAAMDWALANHALAMAMRFGCALSHFWIRKGYEHEGAERLASLLPLTAACESTPLYGRFLFSVALLNDFHRGDRVRSKPIYEQSLQVCRMVADHLKAAHSLNRLSGFAYAQGDYATWAAYLAEAQQYRRELNDIWGYALIHSHTGKELAMLGQMVEGRAACVEALALNRALGDKWGTILALWNFGQMALIEGTLDEAETLMVECLALSEGLNDRYLIAQAQHVLGRVATAQQRLTQAETLLCSALQAMMDLTNREGIINVLEACAALAIQQNHSERTLCLAALIERQRAADGIVLPPLPQARFDQMIASARQALGPDGAVTAWSTGEIMTLDEAVAYTLIDDGYFSIKVNSDVAG